MTTSGHSCSTRSSASGSDVAEGAFSAGSGGGAIKGQTIVFAIGGTTVCTAKTNADGIAACISNRPTNI
jgi:hypothetical protein